MRLGSQILPTSESSLSFWFTAELHLLAQMGQTVRHRLGSTAVHPLPGSAYCQPIQPNVSVSQLRVLFRLTGTRGAKQSSHVIDSRASSTRAVPADALVKPDSHSLRIAVHLELLPGDCSLFRTFRTLARGVPGLCRVIHDH
jgi:hypothetical protein